MSKAIQDIRNLGPKMAAHFEKVDIHTAKDIEDIGLDAAYARLLNNGVRPHFIAYYCIYLGLQNRPWTDLAADEKDMLRERFDQIKKNNKAKNKGHSELEAALNKLGVIEK